MVKSEQGGNVMAVQDGDGQDLQSVLSLLADLERQLTEATDQSQLFQIRQSIQRCLLEIYLLKRDHLGKEDARAVHLTPQDSAVE